MDSFIINLFFQDVDVKKNVCVIKCESGSGTNVKYKPSSNGQPVRTKTIVIIFMCWIFFVFNLFCGDRIINLNITQNMQINMMHLSLYN